jgi:phosphatidylserine decarboxylase
VQPGGGWVVRLELAWGRWRRACLRRFRPGYVRRMAEKRQGDCPNCPHEVIDSRDLKYTRNVCGYWFRPEDDAFRWRDRLGLARYGLAEVVVFSALFAVVASLFLLGASLLHWSLWIPLAAASLVWLEIIYFFRDPERKVPDDPRALVSPADGVITHLGEVEDADFPGGRALRISIFLSIFNVHVNRIPRTGKIVDVRYFPGEFLDARHAECAVRNEQLWIDMQEPSGRMIRIKQISGAIARRIVCTLKAGDNVTIGQRLGMIKLGSRTEVLLPVAAGLETMVKIGDSVKGAATILMKVPTA